MFVCSFAANKGGDNYGDTIAKLRAGLPSSSPPLLDSYTPTDFAIMDSRDEDLGSTAPCLLPEQTASKTPYMLVQASKDKVVRLVRCVHFLSHPSFFSLSLGSTRLEVPKIFLPRTERRAK